MLPSEVSALEGQQLPWTTEGHLIKAAFKGLDFSLVAQTHRPTLLPSFQHPAPYMEKSLAGVYPVPRLAKHAG